MLIADALGIDLIRAANMKRLHTLYMNLNSQILTTSSFPHTQTSNIRIWSGQHRDYYWIRNNTDQWTDPGQHERKPQMDGIEIIKYKDLEINNWIWKVLEANGYKARASSIPVVLPPIYYNSPEKLEKWFPYPQQDLYDNLRDKERLTMNSLRDIKEGKLDFFCTSFDQPDRLLHASAEGFCTEDFVMSELQYLDKVAKRIYDYCNRHEIIFCIYGDHGPPGIPGDHFTYHYDQKLVTVRHHKHSVIISNYKGKLPDYTDEIYPWMLKFFDIKNTKTTLKKEESNIITEKEEEIVKDRLQKLGYL